MADSDSRWTSPADRLLQQPTSSQPRHRQQALPSVQATPTVIEGLVRSASSAALPLDAVTDLQAGLEALSTAQQQSRRFQSQLAAIAVSTAATTSRGVSQSPGRFVMAPPVDTASQSHSSAETTDPMDTAALETHDRILESLLRRATLKSHPPPLRNYGQCTAVGPAPSWSHSVAGSAVAASSQQQQQQQYPPRPYMAIRRAQVAGPAWDASPWRPMGTVLAQYREHGAACNQVIMSPGHEYFVTGSADHSIRVWDSRRLEKNVTNRSRAAMILGASVTALVVCGQTHTVACATQDGLVNMVRVDYMGHTSHGPAKYRPCQVLQQMTVEPDDYVIQLDHYKNDTQAILVSLTAKGRLLGWDLRSNRLAWDRMLPANQGEPTAMALDQHNHAWICTGSARGVMKLWDIRFSVPVHDWQHPSGCRIRCLVSSLFRDKRVLCSSGHNEVTVWDVEKRDVREIFNAGNMDDKAGRYMKRYKFVEPVLPSIDQTLVSASTKLPPSEFRSIVESPKWDFILTGGTDGQVRYWNLTSMENSCVLDPSGTVSRVYSSFKTDHLTLHHEKYVGAADPSPQFSLKSDAVSLSPIHSVALCQSPYPCVLTGCNNGSIVAWK